MITHSSCPSCGTAAESANFCPRCGISLTAPPPPPCAPAMIPPTPVPMVDPGVVLEYGELQQETIYAGMERTLRGIGIGLIVWGALQLFIGILVASFMRDGEGSPESAGLVLLLLFLVGAVAISEGSWLALAPSAIGLRIAAVTMFAMAALYLFGYCIGIVIAAILISYGVVLWQRLKKYEAVLAKKPSQALLRQAHTMLNTIFKPSKAEKHPALFEFKAMGVLANRKWRGLLQDDLAVIVTLESRLVNYAFAEVHFLPPIGIAIETTGKTALGTSLKGALVFERQRNNGTITADSYQHFLEWQQRHGQAG